jgi:hypothetical protein
LSVYLEGLFSNGMVCCHAHFNSSLCFPISIDNVATADFNKFLFVKMLTLFHNPLYFRTGNAGLQAGSRRKNYKACKGKEKQKLQSARRAKDVEPSHVKCVRNPKMVCNHGRLTSLTCNYKLPLS